MFNTKRDLEFVDTSRLVYQTYPIQLAKDIKPEYFSKQKEKHGRLLFSHCPGMFDQYKYGYIIPAWIDMHIKANKAGSTIILGGSRGHNFHMPRKMDANVVSGIFHPENINMDIWHVGSPWSIQASNDISALINPPVYHSSIVEHLHIWPGIVDYKKFSTVNFIFSPKRECEIHIKAGEPLLHILPFYNKTIKGGYGPATDQQIDKHRSQLVTGEKQAYRKKLHTVKTFILDKLSVKQL